MERLEDDYWTASTTKGFDFDELPQDGVSGIFGVSQSQTAELSKKVKEKITQKPKNPPLQHSTSLLSLSSTSSTTSIPRPSVGVTSKATHKFLSSTVQVESVLGPKDAVRSLLLDMSVDLSPFRKLSDKTSLLDEALKVGDGDVLSKVLLFLQKTLNQSALFSVLSKRNAAAQQYLSILEKQKFYDEAAKLCFEIGQPKAAFVILYSKCMKSGHLGAELDKLLKIDLQGIKGIDQEKEFLKEQILLLERQNVIASDTSTIKRYEYKQLGHLPQIGRPACPNTLVGSSLLATLQYCSRFYWDAQENLITSPHGLKKAFPITEKQFIWNAFIGRLLSGNDPASIVLVKGLLGSPKIVAGLSVTRLLDIAWKLGCQPGLLDQLLQLVDSSQQRYQLAVHYKRHRIAIDVLTSNKDRVGLLQYRDSLKEAAEVDYINNILRVSSTRWKN